MAGKKVPSIQDGLKYYKELIKRATLENFRHHENVLCGANKDKKMVIVIPEPTLWNAILEDEELKKHIDPLSEDNMIDMSLDGLVHITSDLTSQAWIDLDSNILYGGGMIELKIDKVEYEIPLTRECLPIKLRKNECNNLTYRIFLNPSLTIAVKKYFPFAVEGCGITMMRLFKII